jgi:hypothetical protein
VNEFKNLLGEFFGATWSNEGYEPGFEHWATLDHFDGTLHWQVTLDTQKNYLWITGGLRHPSDHIFESHGVYESVRWLELNPLKETDAVPKRSADWHALHLIPKGVPKDEQLAWLARHTNGRIEIEMGQQMLSEEQLLQSGRVTRPIDKNGLLAAIAAFFRAEWHSSGEGSDRGHHLEHFDGRVRWEVRYKEVRNLLWIAGGLPNRCDHVIESYGHYEAGEFHDVSPSTPHNTWAGLLLVPRGAVDRHNYTTLNRFQNGHIELEMSLGKTNNNETAG